MTTIKQLALFAALPTLAHAGVVAHYSFDTDYSDSSGNDNHGTLVDVDTLENSGITTTAGEFVFGGASMNFSADRDYVDIPSKTFGTGTAYTITFWAKKAPGDTGDPELWDMVIGQRDNTIFFIALNDALGVGDRIGFRWRSNTAATGVRQGDYVAPNDNNWHHFALTASTTGTHTFYVDGDQVAVTEGVQTGFILDTIGEAYTTQRDFDFHGQIDEVWFFDEELAPAGISGLYSQNNHLADPAGITIVSSGFDSEGLYQAGFSGLTPGQTYRLMRGMDLENISEAVIQLVAGNSFETFQDPEPLEAPKVFYRLELIEAADQL